MIRIDEIYNHTFWPWVKTTLPQTRMFFCDPPGDSRPQSLRNFGNDDVTELKYIFLHDQEPIHLDVHHDLFQEVLNSNIDLDHRRGPRQCAIITSEYQSEPVEQVCDRFGWQSFYYFFHGWAALDWYRGYDRTFLIAKPEQRTITRSFINANRIIGGRRDHRIMLMYHLLKSGVQNAWMSFPIICPAEGLHISDLSAKLGPDVKRVFQEAALPLCFPGETDHPMHSCWLSLFEENTTSLAHVITETVYTGRRHHLTEKSFKPICLKMPFIMVSTAGSLDYLRRYGFKTFDNIWNEDYDDESDDQIRLQKIAALLKDLDDQSPAELQKMYRASWPVVQHNHEHFYGGGFEQVLWHELTAMLNDIERSFHD